MTVLTVGIVGVGRLGSVLARCALAAGYRTLIAGSGSPARTRASAFRVIQGAEAVTVSEAVHTADIVMLALPFGEVPFLPSADFAGKLVIDATNHWPETDGDLGAADAGRPTSVIVQEALAGARVVKAFNHVSYHDLAGRSVSAAAPPESHKRLAIALAGDAEADMDAVAALIADFGFEPVPLSSLAASVVLEPGRPAFGAAADAETLRDLLRT